ncbi:hypothetical protein WMF37_03660 [Sorangium sp. So ce291]|uniref:hypothetical protein n=1 Tax=Sorangium sp. So ce291 TaxID=3133294 RepID=UPI003F5DB6AB
MKGLRAGLLLALVVIAAACARDGSVAVSAPGAPAAPPAARASAAPPEPTYPLPPCEGDAFRIDLLDAIDAIPDDTLDAQREQLRDWIWTVTLGRIAQQTSVDDVFSGVVDQPVIRDDSLAHVLRLPVGPTRATTTKKGAVIVLVEAASAEDMAAGVLEAIDDEALSLGRTPEQVLIYGYELKTAVAEASICRIGQMDREKLESAEKSYRRATVTTAEELGQFLSGGVDLLSAQCKASGLELTGRQRPRNTRAEVTVEHVAALAQELGVRYIPPAQFGVTLATLPAEMRVEVEERAQWFDQVRADGHLAPKALPHALRRLTGDQQRYLRSLVTWKEENPAAPTAELVLSFFLQQQHDGKPGFSLDPVATVAAATRNLDELTGALPDLGKLNLVLRAWNDAWKAKHIEELIPDRPTLEAVRARLIDLRARLQRASDEDVHGILNTALPDSELDAAIASELMRSVYKRSGQQCARYDGPLSGTATGMTFFYTDILAKFWARGWKGVSPEGEIEGFESVVHHAGSTAWCGEEPRPSTRIWFGVRDEAYAREPSGAVRFAPTATRIFARGSTLGSGEEEVEPNAMYRRFIRWWDNHYARLSGWEPQYEVLNQLMKWSVVTQSARLAGDAGCLRFLDGFPIQHDQRLDRWVASKQDLRWRGPVNLVSTPHKATECVSLISSEPFETCGSERTLIGGVGAASLEQVRAKPLRVPDVPAGLGRLGAEVKPVAAGANRLRFDKLRRSGGELTGVEIEGAGNRLTFQARIDTAASQRGSHSSLDPATPVRKTTKVIESKGEQLGVQQQSNGILGVELTAADLGRAHVRVAVKPGYAEATKTVGQKVATRMARDGVTLPDAVVEAYAGREILHLDDDRIAVRLKGAGDQQKAYAVLGLGSGPPRGPPPPPGVEVGFIGGTPDGPHHARSHHNRFEPVRAWLIKGREAESYVRARSGKPLRGSDATYDAVKTNLDAGNGDAATRAFEQRPTARAAEALVEHAIGRGDFAGAVQVIKRTARLGSAEDLSGLGRTLDRMRAAVRRSGGDPTELARLSTLLAIEGRARLTPGASEAATIRAAGERLQVYAPASYSMEAGLPPALHPRGKPLPANRQYVSQIVEISRDYDLPMTLAGADGIELKLHGPRERAAGAGGAGGDGGSATVQLANTVGSAHRLLGAARYRIAIVRQCSDVDESMPPCHAPDAEAEELVEGLSLKVCDADGDGTLGTPKELACRGDVRRCVLSEGGVQPFPAVRACLGAIRPR